MAELSRPGWRTELDRVTSGALGDPRIRIALIDGPVDLAAPSLHGAALETLDTPDPDTPTTHGTSVAGILFDPASGLVPRCTGLLIPILREHDGSLAASQLDLARAIALALGHGASIINISAGEFDATGEPRPHLADMLRRAEELGVLIVAAAGNDGCACTHVPAANRNVLAVGAADDDGQPLAMSNWGAAYRDHGVLAPGSGTSWATAVVSGVAALLLSEQLRRGEPLDARRVRDAILETADRCDATESGDCARFLTGRLNAAKAWSRIGERRRNRMTEVMMEQPESALPPPIVETGPQSRGVTASCGGEAKTSDCACGGADKSKCTCTDKEKAAEGSCAAKKGPPPLVYVLGQLSYDFASEARRDSLVQQGLTNPYDGAQLLRFLESNPFAATAITWTLLQDATPIYAIHPFGAFAADGYALLRRFLGQQLEQGVERISVPGWVGGKATLSGGQTVPAILPELRGMYSWSTRALIEAVLGSSADNDETREQSGDLANFLERIYFEIRNLGILPQERAINYAATNAFQAGEIYRRAAGSGMKLDAITAERSPICRPESDCWDVKLTFFNPAKRLEQAREVYRITVDVSDVIPVTVGPVRRWFVY